MDKRISERVAFELQSNKKRRHAISRFCHTSDDIIKPSCIYKKTDNVSDLISTIKELSSSKKCYVISSIEEIDSTEMPLENAITTCIGFGLPSILIIDESTAVVETEQDYGASTKYVLHTK
ncbi:MAG: hypothetical protein FWC47_13835 [Oscillospiraceae bacterium]|nr:hypothetical protein [Oscillospiraceae bacterium]